MSFGRKIKGLMEEKNITQKELSQKLNISPSAISNYVQNIREPDFATLKKLAQYFHVSLDYLLSDEAQNTDHFLEEELLRVFGSMTKVEKILLIEQGKVIIKVNRENYYRSNQQKPSSE